MSHETLSQISALTETMFQREFSKIREILKEETVLRQSLVQLDAQSKTAEINHAQDCTMKTVGADILWQAWVSNTRRQLNIELAQILARKIEAMVHVRKAFGRKEAVKSLIRTARQERQQKITQLQAERLSLFGQNH